MIVKVPQILPEEPEYNFCWLESSTRNTVIESISGNEKSIKDMKQSKSASNDCTTAKHRLIKQLFIYTFLPKKRENNLE